MIRAVLCAVAVFVSAGAARAATISVTYPSTGIAAIFVEGKIVLSDYEQFRDKAANIQKAVVLFQSDGGNAIAAIDIGTFIRMRGYGTAVPDGARCASACALAWLGGKIRMMGKTALIGFHAVYDADSGRESGPGNALVGAYLNKIGLSDVAIFYITRAPPSSIAWLTPGDAQKLGIELAFLDPPDSKSPTSPAPPHRANNVAQMQRRAKGLIAYLYHAISQGDTYAGETLASLYADSVNYYGKDMSRDEVLAQTQRLLTRWPARQYQAKDDTVAVACNESAQTCMVTGVLQFDARSTERNQRSSGEASFNFLLRFTPDAVLPKIVAETGSVLLRRKEALTETSDPPISIFDARIR